MAKRPNTIHDERWKQAKKLGLVDYKAKKPDTFSPALKQRLYRYEKQAGELFDRAGKERTTRGGRTYKVTSSKVSKSTARKARSAGYTVIKDRVIIDHDNQQRVKVRDNFEGLGFAVEYTRIKGPMAKRMPRKRIVLPEASMSPGEFTRKLEQGKLPLKGGTYSVNIGNSAPFKKVSLTDPQNIAFYLSSITGIDVPESYQGASV
jgi:hypothetical protein